MEVEVEAAQDVGKDGKGRRQGVEGAGGAGMVVPCQVHTSQKCWRDTDAGRAALKELRVAVAQLQAHGYQQDATSAVELLWEATRVSPPRATNCHARASRGDQPRPRPAEPLLHAKAVAIQDTPRAH